MDVRGRLVGLGTSALVASLAIGAKCPVPNFGHHDGGASDGRYKPDASDRDGGAGEAGDEDAAADTSQFDGGAGGRCAASDPNGIWTTVHPEQSVIGLAALAPNDVWMSGSASVQHWDGSSWTTMLSRASNETFGVIWASGPNDVWVAGDRVRRWNGSAWKDAMPSIPNQIIQIWGLGPNDVWIVANRYLETANPVYHWDGVNWMETGGASGLPELGANVFINAVWGASVDDMWAFGLAIVSSGINAAILRWKDGHWNSSGDLGDPSRHTLGFNGATGTAANDMWLTGYDGKNGAALWHFDGVSFAKVAGFPPLGIGGLPWVSCSNEVWFPLVDGRRAMLAHYRSTTSSVVELPGPSTAVVTGTTSGEVWAGGEGASASSGALFHFHSTADTQPICGDVRVEAGEQCDPPNGVTCDNNCQRIPTCGDGIVDSNEECDPPSPYTCSSSCRLISPCGNGRLDPGEECDPAQPYPRCDQTCHVILCGNRQIDPGEECDPPLSGGALPTPWCDTTCHIPVCGNGQIDPGETCDPPSGGWTPGHGGPTYCGNDCTTHDACAECHHRCDNDPLGFEACKCLQCTIGPYGPCGGCGLP